MEDFTMLSDGNYSANNNHHQQQHHHKDHMLAAGSTQTNQFSYDISIKPEASVLKNDYSMFTNYIQQSTLLERAVDPALDSSCLGGLCDLKFPSDSSSLNATLNNDSHYKPLSMVNIEANNTLSKAATCTVPIIGNSAVNDINSEAASSFSSILFPRDSALNAVGNDTKSIQNCIQTSQNYLNIKSTTTDANLSNEHFLQNSSVVATSSCDIGIMRFTQSSSNNSNNNNNNNNNNSCNNDKQVLQTVVQTNYLNNNDTNPRNDLNINDTSIELIGSSNNNNNNQQSNNNNNGHGLLAHRNTAEHQITTTSSGTKTALHKNDDIATSSSSTILTIPSASKNSEVSANMDSLSQNLSAQSSDCDSLSSDELIDLENNERVVGYQDTTSSHSQQSAGGGGGGGGGLGGGGGGPGSNSGGGTNASNSSVVLLNGGVGQPNNSGGYMSLIPPTVGITSSSGGHIGGVTGGTSASAGGATGEGGSGGGGGIDFKHLFEELCPVCGDKVSGYHYGLLTCESCKGFFKRTVQNKKVYTCVAERSCHIDKTQRKRCPYCRFQKCLEVGMKLEAVRADRMRGGRNKFGPMYKRDRARKLQVMRQRQLALQALRSSIGSTDMKSTPLSPGYQAYPNMNIKQEIQIPQVSSLTQSPDSSPSPIAIALGQVNASTSVITNPLNGTTGSSSNNTSTTSDSINRSGASSCHETGSGSMQNTADSKLCFDSGTHPSSTADSVIEPLRVSPMIRDFVQSIDDREWQTQLFALLQKQTYNQVEVDLFELMCKVLDQNLFSQVDWARNTVFFKDLKVDDQMKLLQHSWSDMLVLDHLHQRIHNGLPDETQLNNGQVFNLLGLGLLGVPQLGDYFNELQNKLQDLKFDMGDYVCMKFLILLNPDVRGIINKKTVLEGHENVQAALLDYTLTCYPSVTDKFRRLLNILPDIHAMAARGEEHLYSKHCAGSAPTQTLLMEMLHAKRKV